MTAPILSRADRDLAAPHECEARRARNVTYIARESSRLADLYAARQLRSHHGIRTKQELFTEVANLISAIHGGPSTDMGRWKNTLAELSCDLENDIADAANFVRACAREA